jgi:hypothetical protein
MPRQYTRAEIRTRIRNRQDQTSISTVSDPELNDYIDESYAELHELLAMSGAAYFESEETITGTGVSTGKYALPTTHFATLSVELLKNGSYYRLDPIELDERSKYESLTGDPAGWRLSGAYLEILPAPGVGTALRHTFVPAAARLADDTTGYDFVAGWESWMVADCCYKCALKEEAFQTAQMFMAERERQWERIVQSARFRNAASGGRVVYRPLSMNQLPGDYPDDGGSSI